MSKILTLIFIHIALKIKTNIPILIQTNRIEKAVKMRIKYVLEFSIEASVTELYEKISTEYGLEQWFANNVELEDDNTYLFEWDEISVHAKVADYKKQLYSL